MLQGLYIAIKVCINKYECSCLFFQSGEVENVLVLLKHFRTSSASLDPLALSDLSLLYESFVLYLVRSMVKTCDKLLKLKPVAADDRVSIGTWVEARSPVRIDLAGGWTDTPPICYEAGGKVTGVAVSIDGEVN